jgi:hypothetical protein
VWPVCGGHVIRGSDECMVCSAPVLTAAAAAAAASACSLSAASKVLHNLGLASSGKAGLKQQQLLQQRPKAYGNGTYSTRPAPNSSSSMQRPGSSSLSSGSSIARSNTATAAGRGNSPVARHQQQQQRQQLGGLLDRPVTLSKR